MKQILINIAPHLLGTLKYVTTYFDLTKGRKDELSIFHNLLLK